MNILIDGYNILKQVIVGEIAERQRRGFAIKALEYAKRKGHMLYIVYDGGPYNRMTTENHGRVVIIYSGHKESADDIIKRYISQKTLKNLLLVTTDRQLNSWADSHEVPSIDSLDFYRYMNDVKSTTSHQKTQPHAQKLHPEKSSPELDALMEEGSSMVWYKEEEPKEASGSHGVSKREKKLLALLNKL